MRRAIVLLGLVAGLALWAGPVNADVGPGPDLGKHLEQVTPEHPREHGRIFGACVAHMAITGECPHGH